MALSGGSSGADELRELTAQLIPDHNLIRPLRLDSLLFEDR